MPWSAWLVLLSCVDSLFDSPSITRVPFRQMFLDDKKRILCSHKMHDVLTIDLSATHSL